jgi:hypothetical protein
VRLFLGFLLLLAATLKSNSLISESAQWGVMDSAVVIVEMALAAWLFWGAYSRVLWRISLIVFGLFALYSLWNALHGEMTCGCFGAVTVSPWVSLGIDLLAVVLLLKFPPSLDVPTIEDHPCLGGRYSFVRRHMRLATGPTVAIALGMIMFGVVKTRWSQLPFAIAPANDLSSTIRVFTPSEWIGSPLPLLYDIDIGERLRQGEWTVVLYRRDCPTCQRLLARHTTVSYHATSSPASPDSPTCIAFIELPSLGERLTSQPKSPQSCLEFGKVRWNHRWVVPTPLVLSIRSGHLIGTLADSDLP